MFRLPALCCKLLYNLTHPPASSEQFSQGYLKYCLLSLVFFTRMQSRCQWLTEAALPSEVQLGKDPLPSSLTWPLEGRSSSKAVGQGPPSALDNWASPGGSSQTWQWASSEQAVGKTRTSAGKIEVPVVCNLISEVTLHCSLETGH